MVPEGITNWNDCCVLLIEKTLREANFVIKKEGIL